MTHLPELSVVMSVYNGQRYLEESITSILRQSFSDFEFIIINDGSTDNSGKLIEQFALKDHRIRTMHQDNSGLIKSLNRGISMARGSYIARQDQDDVSLPNRFEKQLSFLKSHPDIVLCGTWFLEVNEESGSKVRKYPVDDTALRKDIKYANFFCHPSVIFFKDAFIKTGGYDEAFPTAEDFELWIRMAQVGKLANLPEILIKKRIGFGTTISWEKRREKKRVIQSVISKHFGSLQEINWLKFIQYYLPLIIYGYIPTPLLKIIRRIRYT